MLQLKNNFYKVLLALVSLFIWNNYAHSQNIFISKTNQKIWEAKDRNDVVYTLYILKKGNNAEKLLALKGLLSWNDSSFRKLLLKLIKKGNTKVKIAALESIGQSRDSFYIPYLVKIVHKSGGKKIKPEALVALGKCITKSKVHELLKIKNTEQPGYAECIYRAMMNKVGEKSLTDKMFKLLGYGNDNSFYSAWYLARTPYPLTSKNLKEFSINIDKPYHWGDPTDEFIAVLIAIGKAKLDLVDTGHIRGRLEEHLLDALLDTMHKSVNVVSVFRAMALSKLNYDSLKFKYIEDYVDKNLPTVQLAYSELISKNCKAFEKHPNLAYGPAVVNYLKTMECNGSGLKLPITNTIYDQIWKLQLLETDFQNYPIINNVLMQNANPAVKSAAMESLIKCRMLKNFPDNLVSDFNESVSILIKDGDEGVLSIIANAILDKQISLEENYKVLLMEAQSKLKLPIEMEAYLDIEKVKAMINGKPYKKPEAEWNHPIEWDYLSKIKTDQKVKVTTNQGEFIIQMNVNEAPGSVSSILKLIEDGFYNGKFFHRMVPNFVVQGGCPRGDGFGGVDYTIRSEFSSLKYSTGAVGLASSGPNTESCQWFFTHCPTPHLDGRYTIIGYVVEGMEIINKLGVGDKMLKVERL